MLFSLRGYLYIFSEELLTNSPWLRVFTTQPSWLCLRKKHLMQPTTHCAFFWAVHPSEKNFWTPRLSCGSIVWVTIHVRLLVNFQRGKSWVYISIYPWLWNICVGKRELLYSLLRYSWEWCAKTKNIGSCSLQKEKSWRTGPEYLTVQIFNKLSNRIRALSLQSIEIKVKPFSQKTDFTTYSIYILSDIIVNFLCEYFSFIRLV